MDSIGEETVEGAPNIVLEYPVVICRCYGEDEVVFFADSCEFFVDEHGLQWVKFVPKNGHQNGKEHIVRTDCDGFAVVKDVMSL